ncbi:MAG: HAD family phosphatase [Bacteroidales bacterium]|nr:HAD family phosphatase [Bacteroidales bacterium]
MIKNIIFDLGGVILNINFQLAAESFKKLGLEDFEGLYSKATQTKLFDRLEKGLISNEEFYAEIRDLSGINMSDSQIDQAWNSLILDFPPARLQLIKDLRKNYKLFLLSNTNRIHADYYNKDLINNHNIDDLDSIFDKVYYSHDIGLRKPDNAPFEYLLNDQNIKPNESLFIDDALPNILTANQMGINSIFINLDNGHDVLDLFENGKLNIYE